MEQVQSGAVRGFPWIDGMGGSLDGCGEGQAVNAECADVECFVDVGVEGEPTFGQAEKAGGRAQTGVMLGMPGMVKMFLKMNVGAG